MTTEKSCDKIALLRQKGEQKAMRDYFNASERAKHIVVMGMEKIAEELASSTALTQYERNCLQKTKEWLIKFNNSVYERFGDSYKRKILNTLQVNQIAIVSDRKSYNEAISECASEDLAPCIKDLMVSCMNCTKENHKDCAIYNIGVACDIDGTNQGKGCPYFWKLETEEET